MWWSLECGPFMLLLSLDKVSPPSLSEHYCIEVCLAGTLPAHLKWILVFKLTLRAAWQNWRVKIRLYFWWPWALVVTRLNVIREERRDALEERLHVPGSWTLILITLLSPGQLSEVFWNVRICHLTEVLWRRWCLLLLKILGAGASTEVEHF